MTNLTYPRRFFERQPDDVARDLIGSQIVVRADGRSVRALIVETEATGGATIRLRTPIEVRRRAVP